jgi:hypothetical protein
MGEETDETINEPGRFPDQKAYIYGNHCRLVGS